MEGFEFVHLKVVPARPELKFVEGIISPVQTVMLLGALTVGEGLMVILNEYSGPVQPFRDRMIFIVAVIGTLLAFVAVKAGILPVPLA
jgi:hypothetical protein